MSNEFTSEQATVARFREGVLDVGELDTEIASAWRRVITDPALRAEVSTILKVGENDLDPAVPPFRALSDGSGLSGGEIAILALSSFALNLATGAVQKAGADIYDGLKKVWSDVLQERVNPPGKRNLGEEIDSER